MKICKELTILNRKMTAYLHSAITKIGVCIVSHLLLRFLLPLGTFSCDNRVSTDIEIECLHQSQDQHVQAGSEHYPPLLQKFK